jgi:ubiquinone biosynthesis protein
MYYTRLGQHTTNAVRLAEVAQVFVRHGFADLLRRIGFHDGLPARLLRGLNLMEAPEGEPATFGKRLRDAFMELGPAYVKFGQVLSTRPDLLGPGLAQELSLLQDQVAPLPFSTMSKVIEDTLGAPPEVLFETFDTTPVASAGSLSQVYRATLHSGEQVAVKIQRPGAAKTIEADIGLMRQLAEWVRDYLAEAQWADPPGVVDEFARSVRRELDFAIEARMITRFRALFAEDTRITVPEVFEDFCSSHVLTMGWVDGVRVDRLEDYAARGCDPRQVAINGCELLARMVFEHHLFHADPHPGNVFITRDNQLAFLDLGMAGHLEKPDVAAVADLLLAMFHQDAHECASAALMLTAGNEPRNRDAFEHEIADFIAFEAQAIIGGGQVAKGIERATQILHRYNLQLAPRFSLLLKALATIEIVGRGLDPKLDFVPILEPHVRAMILDRYGPAQMVRDARLNAAAMWRLGRQIPSDFAEVLQQLRKGRIRVQLEHDRIDHLTGAIDRSSNRNALALIVAGLIIGSSIVFASGPGTSHLATFGLVFAGLLGIGLIFSILWSRKY